MKRDIRKALEDQRERLQADVVHVRRRYMALGLWGDNLRLTELKNRLWDVEEQLRTMTTPTP